MTQGIIFNSDSARTTMKQIIENILDTVEVYLVGGAVRNALVKKYLGKTWIQRDYDQAITQDSSSYFNYLESIGFNIGSINDVTHKAMSKPVVENAREISYEDNLVFDMHMVDGTTIQNNLAHSTGLSINGFALNIRDIFSEDWESKLISLPGALDSIKNRRININQDGYTSESNYFFALLRFMGAGFSAPSHEDVVKLLKTTQNLSPERYARNIPKLVNYIGGEDKVREIQDSLDIDDLNIFDEQKTKELASRL